MSEFLLIHKASPQPWEWELSSPSLAIWATCLRRVAMGTVNDFHLFESLQDEETQVFRGADAYAHLLSIVCGMQSPLIGETEVFGQFKSFIDLLDAEKFCSLLPILRHAIKDAKMIRHDFLRGVGGMTYGRFVRRQVFPGEPVHVIGAGQLAGEILPWLKNHQGAVQVHARRMPQVLCSGTFVMLGSQPMSSGVVVIAAPVDNESLEKWLVANGVRLVIDLRGEEQNLSWEQSKLNAVQRIELAEVMQTMAKDQKLAAETKAKVLVEIQKCARAFAEVVKIRPQGWDDLCA